MIDSEKRSKLLWRCRRGMLELDLLLGGFVRHSLDALSDEQIAHFETLLTYTDPELYALLMGQVDALDAHLHELVLRIRNSHPLR